MRLKREDNLKLELADVEQAEKDALALKIRTQLKAMEKAQAEEEEAKDKKGKAEIKGRKVSKATATNQLNFKKKRTSLFQTLFGRK